MIYENYLFSIHYEQSEMNYIEELIDALNTNLSRIMYFFQIHDFKVKKLIYIWNCLSDYIAYLCTYVSDYHNWMVADTFNSNINILSYDLYLAGAHSKCDMSDYKKIIIHELIHICQQEINPNAQNVIWFWEALATNLSDQVYKVIDIPYTKNDLMYHYPSLKDSYSVSYTIGRYLLENYENHQILEYVKSPAKLINDTDILLSRIKEWRNS